MYTIYLFHKPFALVADTCERFRLITELEAEYGTGNVAWLPA